MKKYSSLLLSCLALASVSIAFSSCKDDEPPVKYNLTFSKSTSTGVESDATIEIEIKLDKPAPQDITVDYTLNGSAYDNVRAQTEEEYADFEVDGDYGEIKIKKGETSAVIKLLPYSDDLLEDDETIEVTIKSVDNTDVLFVATDKSTVTLTQEDGIIVYLEWPASSTANGFVDMDLFVRIGETPATWNGVVSASVYRSFEYNEYVFIPKTFTGKFFGLNYTNTTFGLSYTYYDGTREALSFTSTFIDLSDGNLEPVANRQVFPGNYTLTANKNMWVYTPNATPNGLPTAIAQTFRNVGGSFVEFTNITTPASSSRTTSNANDELINPSGKYHRASSFAEKVLPKKFKNQL